MSQVPSGTLLMEFNQETGEVEAHSEDKPTCSLVNPIMNEVCAEITEHTRHRPGSRIRQTSTRKVKS